MSIKVFKGVNSCKLIWINMDFFFMDVFIRKCYLRNTFKKIIKIIFCNTCVITHVNACQGSSRAVLCTSECRQYAKVEPHILSSNLKHYSKNRAHRARLLH